MNKIKVHVLNFHGIFSHIEIVLENTASQPHVFFCINRWDKPSDKWSTAPRNCIDWASSTYSFDIYADPDEISSKWRKYWYATESQASILGLNCATAAQWFLREFAAIPNPDHLNVSWNHLAFGIVWSSLIPCPVTLPGRIMSNAKFYMEAKTNPQIANQYSHLFLYTSMALAILVFAGAMFALVAAATILSGGIAAIAIAGCASVSAGSIYSFFESYNTLSVKHISGEFNKTEEQFECVHNTFMSV